ncbi:MAG: RNA-binding S4 domain-containing protein [Chitinophagales bacterium]|nr:RNA-binding S4 domain-containing protein [Bacteroidota bacterium]MCB9044289.1 RNA-binding S4 domain-containing protein [Chitinophagales bacterium]
MATLEKTRIDKWLWAVRVFKTRSLATDACNAGKVKINGSSIKPSYLLKIGETVHIKKEQQQIIYQCTQIIEKRVSAELAAECFEDLSPPPPPKEKTLDAAFIQRMPVFQRKRGEGRPTKKDRRDIDKLIEDNWDTEWYLNEE